MILIIFFQKMKSFYHYMISLEKRNKKTFYYSKVYFGNWKPFENDEKSFLFHLKSSFCSQYI